METLLSQDDPAETGIVCVYIDHTQEFESVDYLRSLLKDVVLRKGMPISQPVRDLYRKHASRGKTPPSLDETVDTLRHELSKFKKLFCVIDGLDEAEKRTRVAFIRELAQFPSLRLLITGRPFVENVLQDIFGNDCQRVEILASDGDIQKFVKGEIENFDKHLRKKVELEKYEEVLVDTVTKKANGMY
jgi:ankyrin repeat domain-containing protein 50